MAFGLLSPSMRPHSMVDGKWKLEGNSITVVEVEEGTFGGLSTLHWEFLQI